MFASRWAPPTKSRNLPTYGRAALTPEMRELFEGLSDVGLGKIKMSELLAVASGAGWPTISKWLQKRGVPEEQADLVAQQIVSGKAPAVVNTTTPPARAGLGTGTLAVGAIGLGLVVAYTMTRPVRRSRRRRR